MQAAYARHTYASDDEEDYTAAAIRGAHVSVAVEMEGEDPKTSASLPDPTRKNRFYLLNFDADTLAAMPNGKKAVKMASRYGYGNPGMLLGAVTQLGLPIMETNRMATVEFK